MSAAQDLRHEEIWDDTELVDSWNAAVEEYKYYHSLHARGEKVEDVLRKIDEANAQDRGSNAPRQVDDVGENVEDGEIHKNYDQSMLDVEAIDGTASITDNQNTTLAKDITGIPKQSEAVNATSGIGLAVPQTLLSGQDEALKGLVMSWYYAGYYTGLYEGQQKAQVNNGAGGD